MAKILLGPTVIGIRGTVAGITFSQNRAGPYARGWHKPANPRTAAQRAAQLSLATWATNWRDVSAADQADWATYAADPAQELTDSLGQPYYASGFNWYVTINKALALMGSAATDTPPAGAAAPAATYGNIRFRVTGSAGTTRWQYAFGGADLALYHVIYAAVVNSIGFNVAPATDYFMICAVPNASRQISFSTEQEAKWGQTFLGQRMFMRTYALSAEGRYGPEATAYIDGESI